MPMNDVVRGNTQWSMILNVTLSPASVANATSAEQTFTVQGLAVGDFVNISKPTSQAGLGIVNSRVTAANTLGITFMNSTAATITPTASEVYLVAVDRPYTNPPAVF
jgi:hypothetical protein